MKVNMGTTDQVIRILAAIGIALLYFTNVITGITGIILIILAAVLLITSIFRFCPLYLPFGLSTCKKKQKV